MIKQCWLIMKMCCVAVNTRTLNENLDETKKSMFFFIIFYCYYPLEYNTTAIKHLKQWYLRLGQLKSWHLLPQVRKYQFVIVFLL